MCINLGGFLICWKAFYGKIMCRIFFFILPIYIFFFHFLPIPCIALAIKTLKFNKRKWFRIAGWQADLLKTLWFSWVTHLLPSLTSGLCFRIQGPGKPYWSPAIPKPATLPLIQLPKGVFPIPPTFSHTWNLSSATTTSRQPSWYFLSPQS